MNQFKVALLAAAVLAASGWSRSEAATFQNTTGLVNPGSTITFDGALFAQNTLITSQFNSAGVNFSGSPIYYDGNNSGAGCNFANVANDCLTNYPSFNQHATGALYSIFFNQLQTAVALAFQQDVTAPVVFNVRKNNIDVATFTTNIGVNTPGGSFFGFSGIGTGFDQLQIRILSGRNFVVDNVQLSSATPEPGTLALFGLGLTAAGLFLRRRSA